MPEEITAGTVLGGRYLVTSEVVGTAEGDLVFEGTDQVLNRAVSILVAAPVNATRVAVSAREVAMGTRPSDVQVLDLGLSGASTYLITNTIDAASLLDLAVESDTPYIEPFQTDTLGQEIFGEARAMEPQVYEDDAEYYQELAEEQARRKPRFGGLFSRFRGDEPSSPATGQQPAAPVASEGPDTAETAASGDEVPDDARSHDAGPDDAGSHEGGKDQSAGAGQVPPGQVPPGQAGAQEPLTGPFAAQPTSAADAAAVYDDSTQLHQRVGRDATSDDAAGDESGESDDETRENPAVAAAGSGSSPEGAAAARDRAEATGDQRKTAGDRQDQQRRSGAAGAGSAAAGAAAASTGAGAAAAGHAASGTASGERADDATRESTAGATGRPASHFPREAAGSAVPPSEDSFIATQGSPEGGNHRLTRLIVGLVLVVVLVGAVVFAVQFLSRGSGDNPPVAEPSKSAPQSSAAPSSEKAESASPTPKKVSPEVNGISIVAPQGTAMNARGDSDLDNAIDGEASTSYQTYSYKSPVFGGFTQSMTLGLELEKTADVSSVELSGLNGTGGKVQILVGKSDDVDDAQELYSGSFSGPTLSADIGSGDNAVKGKYVFVTITELPRLASVNSSGLPYGFQVAEIKVD